MECRRHLCDEALAFTTSPGAAFPQEMREGVGLFCLPGVRPGLKPCGTCAVMWPVLGTYSLIPAFSGVLFWGLREWWLWGLQVVRTGITPRKPCPCQATPLPRI